MYRSKLTSAQPVSPLEFRAGTGRVEFRVLASSTHDLDIAIRREDGQTVRVLYRGGIGDSLVVGWNGLDSSEAVVRPGRYVLFVNSDGPAGTTGSQLQLPLDVVVLRQDTLPRPSPLPDSVFLPEQAAGRRGLRSLGGGVLAGIAIAALPAIVGDGGKPLRARFAIAGGVSIAGILGFVSQPRAQPVEDNIRANAETRRAWAEQVDLITAENARRRVDVRIRLSVGSPVLVLRERP
jgi:hypothetical protein